MGPSHHFTPHNQGRAGIDARWGLHDMCYKHKCTRFSSNGPLSCNQPPQPSASRPSPSSLTFASTRMRRNDPRPPCLHSHTPPPAQLWPTIEGESDRSNAMVSKTHTRGWVAGGWLERGEGGRGAPTSSWLQSQVDREDNRQRVCWRVFCFRSHCKSVFIKWSKGVQTLLGIYTRYS